MLEENFEKLNKAYEDYNLDEREEISLKILRYIRNRLENNKDNLQELSEILNDVSYERIMEIFDEEISKPEIYKKEKVLKQLEDGFKYGIYTTSIGNVVVECENVIEVLKYFIYAIQSRNTITISDREFEENDLKHAIFLIFTEAMEKFDINKNLINIMPYEECYYENFDLVINLYENKIEKKHETSKLFIYKASDEFEENIRKEKEYLDSYNCEYEVLFGDFKTVTEKINKEISNGAVIYTNDPNQGYKFLNIIHSKNVFVNTSFAELDKSIKPTQNALYMKKKIMYLN